jgi:serine protease
MESENGQAHVDRPERQKIAAHPRVVVKFRDDLPFTEDTYTDGAEEYVRKLDLGPWDRLVEGFPGITLTRLYTTLAPERIGELVARAMEADRGYRPPNFYTYFVIDVPCGLRPWELAASLSAWDGVERAYVESKPAPAPTDYTSYQGYLDPAAGGIDAKYAWTQPGGRGAGIRFADLEKGWKLDHADLLDAAGNPVATLVSGENKEEIRHGTNVLGVLVAQENGFGCTGIVPEATAKVISSWRTPATYNIADAIMSACDPPVLGYGDILLIEAQVRDAADPQLYWPVEAEQAIFDSIRLATALGIVVVEAAGNGHETTGGEDLADCVESGKHILDRDPGNPDFRDSGAIMVGAASSLLPHARVQFSNYGARVDCYAWGEWVTTTDTDDDASTTGASTYHFAFGRTSSAAAIIAGAAVAVQGVANHTPGYGRLAPYPLRALLSDPANGTPSADPAVDRIGVMPDLKEIVDNGLNLAPDVYIRDYVGDTGLPHTGPISSSPDIILRPALVADPGAAFGQASGTANDDALGYEAQAGQDNYVYVRVLNRGGTAASNVVASVYWSPVSTLVTPDLWTLVGSVTIPAVPPGDVLAVSAPITWSSVPATGHYCFVGLIGNAQDPAPSPGDLIDFDNFRLFIRRNNNVTWRNFNVVDSTPPPSPDGMAQPIVLPFLATGVPDRASPMQLEIETTLPAETRVWLEGPQDLAEALVENKSLLERDKEGAMARLLIDPTQARRFKETRFPARFRAEMALTVDIPKALRDNVYELYIRQLYLGEEVGRITWYLAPRPSIDGSSRENSPMLTS